MMLLIADWLLYCFHIVLTLFNIFGWIPKASRKIHRLCVFLTAICWLAVGAMVGKIGYCPLTDWHWHIKYMRGERELPSSFITYLANQLNFYPDPYLVEITVGIAFASIILITGAIWLKERIRA